MSNFATLKLINKSVFIIHNLYKCVKWLINGNNEQNTLHKQQEEQMRKLEKIENYLHQLWAIHNHMLPKNVIIEDDDFVLILENDNIENEIHNATNNSI